MDPSDLEDRIVSTPGVQVKLRQSSDSLSLYLPLDCMGDDVKGESLGSGSMCAPPWEISHASWTGRGPEEELMEKNRSKQVDIISKRFH